MNAFRYNRNMRQRYSQAGPSAIFFFRYLCRAIFLTAVCLAAVPAVAQASGTVYVNVATAYAGTWATGQSIPLSTTVVDSTQQKTPTGPVQFYVNGQATGAPVVLTSYGTGVGGGVVFVTLSSPGTDTLTATYSGDANFAAANSNYSWPFVVAVNPPTLVPVPSPSSISINAGATTGNIITITMEPVNGCPCDANWTTTIATVTGTTTPGTPATLTLSNDTTESNGNIVYTATVNSTAPRTITTQSRPAAPFGKTPILAAACLLSLLPFAGRARRIRLFLLPLAALFCVASMTGCGGAARAGSTPNTETIPGSAGDYNITIAGTAFGTPTAGTTYYSVTIPVTIH